MKKTSMAAFNGVPVGVGDRVIPVCWGDVPLWLSNTPATVVGLGRTRLHVHFDQVTYKPGDKPHSAPARIFKKL